MTLVDRDAFVERLGVRVPEAAALVREHFEDHDELLIHLLMPDLLRLAVQLFHAGDLDAERRLLDVIELALVRGDAALRNAVQVSFLEDVGAFPGETPAFIASWPEGLGAELRRTGCR